MIDEKTLIEELTSLLTSSEMMGYLSAFDVVQDCIEIVEKQPKTDWIPCEERLPIIEEEPSEYAHDIGERYLITDSEGYVYESTFWKGENDFEDYAIAWMPKPQPYKKEGADDE